MVMEKIIIVIFNPWSVSLQTIIHTQYGQCFVWTQTMVMEKIIIVIFNPWSVSLQTIIHIQYGQCFVRTQTMVMDPKIKKPD
jgi:hypothetical protein